MGRAGIFDDLAALIADPSGFGILLAASVVLVYVLALVAWALARRRRPGRRADSGARVPTWATPRGRPVFIAAAAAFAVSIWLAAWLLAGDKRAFLAAREWQVQPLYLLAHFATLRLFASIFAFNFMAGAGHLDMKRDEAGVAVGSLLGVPALLVGAVMALPFVAFDLRYFLSPRYVKLSGGAVPSPADWLMFGIWALEWVLNGIVWMLLIGFLWLNLKTLRAHAFRSPIHMVLHERQYRPFLRMSAQGATVMVVFSLLTAAYIAYAGGELTDYLGLVVTTLLLAVSFVPPWLLLRRKIKVVVKAEAAVLHGAIGQSTAGGLLGANVAGDAPRREMETLALLRLMHLERLHEGIGQREARDVGIKLLAPAATVGWQVWQNGAVYLERALAWLRTLGG
jgi:hypothetical protein